MSSLEIIDTFTWSQKFDLWMEYMILQLSIKHDFWVFQLPYYGLGDNYKEVGNIRIYHCAKDLTIPSMESFYKIYQSIDRGENWKERGWATRYSIPSSIASDYYTKFKR